MSNDVSVAFRIHEISCQLEWLTTLLSAIVERIEAIGEHLDPVAAAMLVANLARLAEDYLAGIVGRCAAEPG